MKERRVVVTGLGVVAPNGIGLGDFRSALKEGRSGIRFDQQLADLQFSCRVSGTPPIDKENLNEYFTDLELRNFNSTGIMYGVIAGLDAWKDAGLEISADENPDWDSGTIFGAGALVIEDLESALARNAKIYCEILGGNINSGGQRGGGSMTAPNSTAVQKCVKDAIKDSGIEAKDIDYISGHLTATSKDATEIQNLATALNRSGKHFPSINSMKALTGHCLSAAASIECVATVLQLSENFIAPNINCEDLNEEISAMIDADCIPLNLLEKEINIAAKVSFGFGDVNGCVIFKKYS